ncbi:TPA: YSIRK-type signal peptide-containing protein [Staphylococcus delphini]|nr:YSIRK-type signal peptide-containing protein [Staphylococcus delphini]HEC2190931.1 YSIRK-type signal peptide-containing protein [Staphylococcus delphini]HEC2197071.1 YSIRK-type signal peptide-containing protein [Staphylococcus delphini]HEC2200133.1 YSIRK-type signal peptide-containing protein [Staphylococcus delphini]HEC2205523.1 YSIRK-type signal peptide-containing protein [Staphylococcus delphini]
MLREKYKLRKLKVGLVSTAAAMIFVISNGTAEASESSSSEVSEQVDTVVTEDNEAVSESAAQEEAATIRLDEVRPGDTKISGYTQPNKAIYVKIDNKDTVSLEDDFEEVLSDDEGKFTYDLNGRKIVYNQKIDVEATTSLNELEEEFDEEALEDEDMLEDKSIELEATSQNEVSVEEEAHEGDDVYDFGVLEGLENTNSAKASVTTPRYENAYQVPEKRLAPMQDQHQVWIEPILEGSGIIKGHTSVKGQVALAINHQHVHLGDKPAELEKLDNQAWQRRYDGIWRQIDNNGFFEFDLNRLPFKSYPLKRFDLVTLAFKSDDASDEMGPVVFNVRTEPFERVAEAQTVYQRKQSDKVEELKDVDKEVEVQPIFGDVRETEVRAEHKVIVQGTDKIEGRTKYANAIVQVESSLGQYRNIPTLQVDGMGHFIFNLKASDIQLLNGEKLTFKVMNPHTNELLGEAKIGVIPAGKNNEILDDDYVYRELTDEDKARLKEEILRSSIYDDYDEVAFEPIDETSMQEVGDDAKITRKEIEEETEVSPSKSDNITVDKGTTFPRQWEASNDNDTMDTFFQTTEMADLDGSPIMVRYDQRMPLLQLMQRDYSEDVPPLALRVNMSSQKTTTPVKSDAPVVSSKENVQPVTKDTLSSPVPPSQTSISTPSVEMLPRTGTAEKVSMGAIGMVIAGLALVLYRRRGQSS